MYPPHSAEFQTVFLVTTPTSIPPSVADSKTPTLFSLESNTKSPTYLHKGPGSVLGPHILDVWWKTWYWDRIFFAYINSPKSHALFSFVYPRL